VVRKDKLTLWQVGALTKQNNAQRPSAKTWGAATAMNFSYRHLYYFWVVAHEGGMARGAERLGMAVQTVSAQVRELERALGHGLFKPAGRGLQLTEAGTAALRQADQIFQLGQALPALVRDAVAAPAVRLAVGIADGLPKLVVRHYMEPVIHEPNLRLLCREGELQELLAQLALHRLDVVLADLAPPAQRAQKLYSHRLGTTALAWYGTPALAERARQAFPASMADVPVLLPTTHLAVRSLLDQWFARHGLRPRVVGEFEDSASLKTFGASGLGVFPAAALVHDDVVLRYGVEHIGSCDGVVQEFHAIGTEKKVHHPLVQRLLARAA
jgi:LysR family transcriptional regulator, transcriptional activator of nhaA